MATRLLVTLVFMALALVSILPHAYAVNAVGISDNGTAMLADGRIIEYHYNTSSVMGVLTFYNGSYTNIGFVSGNAFSVQLNLVVTNGRYYYWVQDIAHVEPIYGGSYMVWFWDDLWNISHVNAYLATSLISGNRTYPSQYRYIAYYRYVAPPLYITHAPLTVGCMVTVGVRDGYMTIGYWYMLNSTDANTGWVLYDVVTVRDPSSQAYIVVGGVNPGNLSNDIEWVVAGYTAAAQLYVASWSAVMDLRYFFNGSWYTPPGGQSRSFDTGESVDPVHGIWEFFERNLSVVRQLSGSVNDTYLWPIYTSLSYEGNYIEVSVNPPGGRWVMLVDSPFCGLQSANVLNSSMRYGLRCPWGPYYTVMLTLYGGETPVYTHTYVIIPYTTYVALALMVVASIAAYVFARRRQ